MAELTASEYEVVRDTTSRPIAEARADIVKQYESDKLALEEQYHEDLKTNDQQLRDAYVAAGLNSDGTQPLGRPTG